MMKMMTFSLIAAIALAPIASSYAHEGEEKPAGEAKQTKKKKKKSDTADKSAGADSGKTDGMSDEDMKKMKK